MAITVIQVTISKLTIFMTFKLKLKLDIKVVNIILIAAQTSMLGFVLPQAGHEY